MSNDARTPDGRGLATLLFAQSQVLFNDNGAKIMLVALCAALNASPLGQPDDAKTVLYFLMILPLVAFSPLVSWLSDAFSKRDVLVRALWLQLAIMGVLTAGLMLEHLGVAVLGFFLLGVQSAIFSPAKQGIVKELVGHDRLPRAVSLLELTAFGGILIGSLFGGQFFDHLRARNNNPWGSAEITTAVLGSLALVAAVVSHRIPRTPAQAPEPFRWSLLWGHGPQLRAFWSIPVVRWSILAYAWFIALGGAVTLSVIESAKATDPAKVGTLTGLANLALGVGIILGSGLVALLVRRGNNLWLVPAGGVGMTLCLVILSRFHTVSPAFLALLAVLGLLGALWMVPVTIEMQDQTPPARRGIILGANNLITYFMGLAFIGVQFGLREFCHLAAPHQYLAYAALQLAVTLAALRLCLPKSPAA